MPAKRDTVPRDGTKQLKRDTVPRDGTKQLNQRDAVPRDGTKQPNQRENTMKTKQTELTNNQTQAFANWYRNRADLSLANVTDVNPNHTSQYLNAFTADLALMRARAHARNIEAAKLRARARAQAATQPRVTP